MNRCLSQTSSNWDQITAATFEMSIDVERLSSAATVAGTIFAGVDVEESVGIVSTASLFAGSEWFGSRSSFRCVAEALLFLVESTPSLMMNNVPFKLKSAHFFGEFLVAFTDCSFAATFVVETDYLFLLSHWVDYSFESVRTVCSFAIALFLVLDKVFLDASVALVESLASRVDGVDWFPFAGVKFVLRIGEAVAAVVNVFAKNWNGLEEHDESGDVFEFPGRRHHVWVVHVLTEVDWLKLRVRIPKPRISKPARRFGYVSRQILKVGIVLLVNVLINVEAVVKGAALIVFIACVGHSAGCKEPG